MQAHKVTRQLEYAGSVVDLTEALTSLPSGGQVMLGSLAAERVAGRLRDIVLPYTHKRRRLDSICHALASGTVVPLEHSMLSFMLSSQNLTFLLHAWHSSPLGAQYDVIHAHFTNSNI